MNNEEIKMWRELMDDPDGEFYEFKKMIDYFYAYIQGQIDYMKKQ